ncbi:MAG TPA: chloramphenicol acetyltransferase [Gemmatimonadota bacterium]|nr:chloramphenicol acetyltransferase [Gemmatimonadota bacterium]
MSPIRRLDLATWNRREHFAFYRGYDNPYFNICAPVDVTRLLERSRSEGGPSFFLGSLWASLAAVNEIEELRYRIRGEDVVVHDRVHGGSTVLVPDGTFRFGYFDYDPDFWSFAEGAASVLERVRAEMGPLEARPERDDMIHYSIIPWVAFTSFSHARRWGTDDSVPKVVFGRHQRDADADRMPVSIEVHHALVDGLHVGRFFERFQHHLDELATASLSPAGEEGSGG